MDNDLISRQATLDAICKAESKQISKDFAYCEDALGRAENAIGNLPSIQPEPCEDTISRKAATEKTEMLYRDVRDDTSYMLIGYNHALSDMRAILKSLPSTQCTERRTDELGNS